MKKTLLFLLLLNAANAFADIYTWKDARGTTHYANNLYDIPKRYQSRAKMLDIATGKKVPIPATPATASPAPAGQPPTAAPAQPAPMVLPPQAGAHPAAPAPGQPPVALPAPRATQPQPPVRGRVRPSEEEE